MSDFVKAVIQQAEARLKSYEESIVRTADQGVAAVKHAREELRALEEATKLGASQSFLGASAMMVGVSEYPLSPSSSPFPKFTIDHCQQIELHGDPEAIKRIQGRCKVIVLLYKVD